MLLGVVIWHHLEVLSSCKSIDRDFTVFICSNASSIYALTYLFESFRASYITFKSKSEFPLNRQKESAALDLTSSSLSFNNEYDKAFFERAVPFFRPNDSIALILTDSFLSFESASKIVTILLFWELIS